MTKYHSDELKNMTLEQALWVKDYQNGEWGGGWRSLATAWWEKYGDHGYGIPSNQLAGIDIESKAQEVLNEKN